MDILKYRKLGKLWQVCDLEGRTAEGISKEDARIKYYLYYKTPTINMYERSNILSTEELTLNN